MPHPEGDDDSQGYYQPDRKPQSDEMISPALLRMNKSCCSQGYNHREEHIGRWCQAVSIRGAEALPFLLRLSRQGDRIPAQKYAYALDPGISGHDV